jgi:Glycosyl transferase family 2
VSEPLISVVIPAFNAGAFIEATLDSVLGQTYARREVIVVDDGSTDDTAARVARYGPVVRSLRQANAGQSAARNAGVEAATGQYLAFLDADDVWLPDALATQQAIAAAHPASGLVACDGIAVDGDHVVSKRLLWGPLAARLAAEPGGVLTGHLYREMVAQCPITTPGQTLIPRAVIEHVGPMQAERYISGDWEYYLRIAARYPITVHCHPLFRYCYRSSSASGPRALRGYRWTLRGLPVLKLQLRECAPAERPLVRQTIRAAARTRAREAYYRGRQQDLAWGRAYLRQLARRVPTDPQVLGWALGLWLPEPLLASLRGIARLATRRRRALAGTGARGRWWRLGY